MTYHKDYVTLDSSYGKYLNPYAFQASKKEDNLDVLLRSQMMEAED